MAFIWTPSSPPLLTYRVWTMSYLFNPLIIMECELLVQKCELPLSSLTFFSSCVKWKYLRVLSYTVAIYKIIHVILQIWNNQEMR